ncbi:MAG TPA: hypothetical protein VF796_24035 [Humisphaera sp.]
MTERTLDYASPAPPPAASRGICPQRVAAATSLLTALALSANAAVLVAAYHDRRWGAVGFAVRFGLATNAVLVAAAVASAAPLKRWARGASVGVYLLVGLLFPALGLLIDLLVALLMPRYGT